MRYLQLLCLMLLSVVWAVAQTSSPQTDSAPGTQTDSAPNAQTDSSQTSSNQNMNDNSGGQTTVQGCLSGTNGNYMLTDQNGMKYQLSGDTAKMSEHVGHEVKITGTTSGSASSGDSSGGSSGSAMGETKSQTLQVSSMKHIAKTCQTGGMSH